MFKIECEGKVVNLQKDQINGKEKSFTKTTVTLEHNSNYKGKSYTKYVEISCFNSMFDEIQIGNEVIIKGYTETRYYNKQDGSQGSSTGNTASNVFVKPSSFQQTINENDVPY